MRSFEGMVTQCLLRVWAWPLMLEPELQIGQLAALAYANPISQTLEHDQRQRIQRALEPFVIVVFHFSTTAMMAATAKEDASSGSAQDGAVEGSSGRTTMAMPATMASPTTNTSRGLSRRDRMSSIPATIR